MLQQFSDLGINKALQQSLEELEIKNPTDIQIKTIPVILSQHEDIVALAKTGTGKTAAFGLPLLQLINTKETHIQAVILAPTRELSHQIYAQLQNLSSQLPLISMTLLSGGVPIKPQIEQLQSTSHIIIATPGRLVDLIDRKALDLNQISFFVLDEADEMLSALKEEVDEIIKSLSKNRRTLLFTATMSGRVKQLVNDYMSKHTLHIEADMFSLGHRGIEHQYTVVAPIEKLDVLMYFLNSKPNQQGIIFCKTKAAVNKLAKNLAINKFSSGALHGSLSQGIRDRIMGQFRDGHIKILVATDLAARGLDIKDLGFVVNYHLPDTYETYVHRSGRTARAGTKGYALTILQEEEVFEIAEFEEELGINFTERKKADTKSLEDNKTLLWAKKIFKTKPNKDISESLKEDVKTVFHHLTKDELIEKLLAYQVAQSTISNFKPESSGRKKNKK